MGTSVHIWIYHCELSIVLLLCENFKCIQIECIYQVCYTAVEQFTVFFVNLYSSSRLSLRGVGISLQKILYCVSSQQIYVVYLPLNTKCYECELYMRCGINIVLMYCSEYCMIVTMPLYALVLHFRRECQQCALMVSQLDTNWCT